MFRGVINVIVVICRVAIEWISSTYPKWEAIHCRRLHIVFERTPYILNLNSN